MGLVYDAQKPVGPGSNSTRWGLDTGLKMAGVETKVFFQRYKIITIKILRPIGSKLKVSTTE